MLSKVELSLFIYLFVRINRYSIQYIRTCCRDFRPSGCSASGNAAGPSAVHPGRLRPRPLLQTADQVRQTAPHVAQSALDPTGHCGTAVLQRDHWRHTDTEITGRHVPHGKIVRLIELSKIYVYLFGKNLICNSSFLSVIYLSSKATLIIAYLPDCLCIKALM